MASRALTLRLRPINFPQEANRLENRFYLYLMSNTVESSSSSSSSFSGAISTRSAGVVMMSYLRVFFSLFPDLKTRSSRQAMRKAVKAHATITAAFRVGRSRSRLEMRVTRASPLLLELPPPATAASPDPVRVVFTGPEPGGGCSGRGAAADWTRLAWAAGTARSTSSSNRSGGSSSSSGAARIVQAGGVGPGRVRG